MNPFAWRRLGALVAALVLVACAPGSDPNNAAEPRAGNEPPAEVNDRPEQNVAYDEVVKGAPLSAEERERAKRESPLSE